jgi:predicted  nucleic acid-binding Zn-ribbon protein
MFPSKAHRIRSLEAQVEEQKGVRSSLIARGNRLERELEDARNELQEQKAARSGLIARVERLERELEDARNDSRSPERPQALEVVGPRE